MKQQNTSKLRNIYDSVADTYDQRYRGAQGLYYRLLEERPIAKFLDVKGKRVVDIGAGTGRFALMFARTAKRVAALDISLKCLARAKQKAAKASNVDFIVSDVQAISFLPESFDAAISSGSLASATDLGPSLEQVYRILRPGGYFLFTVVNSKPLLGVPLRGCRLYEFARHSLTQIEEALGGNGFYTLRATTAFFLPMQFVWGVYGKLFFGALREMWLYLITGIEWMLARITFINRGGYIHIILARKLNGCLDEDRAAVRRLTSYIDFSSKDFSRPDFIKKQIFREDIFGEETSSGWLDVMKKTLGTLSGAKVLDLGSGSGVRAAAIAMENCFVAGIDLLPDGLHVSKWRAGRYPGIRAHFIQADALNVPFADEAFDIVTNFCLLEHMEDTSGIFTEMKRVLKKGGILYCEVPNADYPYEGHYRMWFINRLPRVFGKLYLRLRNKSANGMDQFGRFNKRDIEVLLRGAGFTDIREVSVAWLKDRILDPKKINNTFGRLFLSITDTLRINRLIAKAVEMFSLAPTFHFAAKKDVL